MFFPKAADRWIFECCDGKQIPSWLWLGILRYPNRRNACYSSDLLIRQYDRQRSRRKKKFTYRDLKKVYTLVLVEKSSREFHQISNTYLHHSRQVFDSGLELELLQEYIFIALDIFHKITHNINSKLEAWLLFLSSDELEDMIKLVSSYPEFEELYHQLAEFQTKPEEVISMYNETLALMDKNTVELMIEEQQEEIKKLDEEVRKKKAELKRREKELKKKDKELKSRDEELKNRDEELKNRDEKLKSKDEELEQLRKELGLR